MEDEYEEIFKLICATVKLESIEYDSKEFDMCFFANEAIDIILQYKLSNTREEAQKILAKLLIKGYIHSIYGDQIVKDEKTLYQLNRDNYKILSNNNLDKVVKKTRKSRNSQSLVPFEEYDTISTDIHYTSSDISIIEEYMPEKIDEKKFQINITTFFPKRNPNFGDKVKRFFDEIFKLANKNLHESNKLLFLQAFEEIMVIALQENVQWNELFVAHLAIEKKSLDPQFMNTILLKILHYYIQMEDRDVKFTKNYYCINFVAKGIKLMQKHMIDIENTLLGRSVSKSILDLLENSYPKIKSTPKIEFENIELIRKIFAWSEIRNTSILQTQVMQFCNALKGENLSFTKEGDLIIFKDVKTNKMKYGKFFRFIDNVNIEIKDDIFNSNILIVSSETVRALPAEMLNSFFTSPLESFVEDPFLTYIADYESKIGLCVDDYMDKKFVESGLSKTSISKYQTMKFEIEDLNDMKKMLNVLKIIEKFDENKFHPKYPKKRQNFIKNINSIKITECFLPNIESSLSEALKYEKTNLFVDKLTAHLKSNREQLEGKIEELEKYIRKVLTGEEKKEVSDWWHVLIEKNTESFLSSKGFIENCTSFDYINTPPLNWEGVKSNFHVMNQLLEEYREKEINNNNKQKKTSDEEKNSDEEDFETSSEDFFGVINENPNDEILSFVDDMLKWKDKSIHKLIHEMKEKIYHKIDEHIKVTLRVLKFVLHFEDDEVTITDDIEIHKLEIHFEKVKSLMETILVNEIDNRFKDLHYLLEMRRLEDNPQEKQMHIVPVSGLCFSRFVRIQNEMKTVIELWGSKFDN